MYVIRRSLIFDSIVSCQIVFSNIFVAFQQMNWLKSNALSWEQRKFGDENDLLTGYPFESEKYVEEGITLIRGMNVKRGYLDLSDENCMKWSSSEGLESYLLEDGDILIQMDGALIGKSYARIAQNQLPALLVQRVTRARTKKDIANSDFMYQTIQRNFLSYIKMNKTETAVPHLSLNDIRDFIIMVPSLAEQIKIGEYFTNIDNLITLHQRKYEKLQIIKKSMLENCFPKNGEKVPRIRFAGFTGDWEQRKLSSIAEEVTRTAPESTAPVMMITANNGFIEQSDRYAFNNAGESLKKYILLEKGEMAYNHGASKLRPYGSCFALTTAESARIPFVYHCFSVGDNDPEFVSMELNGSHVENQLRRIVSSGARMDGLLNISYEEYASVEFMMPSIPEQHTLADYFRQLDILITLHQSKLEKLLKIKKSLLERMFV